MNNLIRIPRCLWHLSVLIILFSACGKNYEKFTPNPPTGSIDNLMANFSDEYEVFNINNADEIIFETNLGSVIHFPANSFTNVQGNAITGNIQIKVKEVKDKTGMVRNGIGTLSSAGLLVSERMFHILAYQESMPLSFNADKEYKIYIPNTNPRETMDLYYGQSIADQIIWDPAIDDRALEINEWFLQVPGGVFTDFGYVLSCNRLEWINVDQLLGEGTDATAKISISLPADLYSAENTMVFITIDDRNAAIRLSYNHNTGSFEESYGALPIDTDVTICVLAAYNESDYHFALKKRTISGDYNYYVVPELVSVEKIKQQLEKL